MRVWTPSIVVLATALLITTLGGCSGRRVEYYQLPDEAAVIDRSAMVDVQILYHKQTQRDFQVVLRITNQARLPLRWTRIGDQALQATLTVAGVAHPALPPRQVTWTPWSVGPQRMSGHGETTIDPQRSVDLELRFEYPQAIGSFRYPWELTLERIQLDVIEAPPVRVYAE